jgi:hypothetical protein
MIKFRVEGTEKELALIKKAARKQGVSVSDFVREVFARNHRTSRKAGLYRALTFPSELEAKHSSRQRAP